ncbi:HDIG domain-containing metalloprotein [Pseudobdellovibrio exovorus]|uniref:Ribonuclease Y n=1 Tax=Pseudobdellovibrio exovorus JSS TaxID=1184267 RepID=M4VAV2_9BACT|nr:HDIG domain-containing metalloprotein [Pseudobdellovibrio exovorus]AGH95600.1 HAD superfamily hydrolase [Pseudobdellovibrio exovorus JSS]
MDITQILIWLAIGLCVGAVLIYASFFMVRQQILNEAKEEATELLKEAREQFEAEEIERKERIQEIELEAWSEVEEQHLSLEQKCEDLELKVTGKKTLNEEKYKTLRSSLMIKENELRDISMKLKDKQAHFDKIIEQKRELEKSFQESLLNKTQLDFKDVLADIQNKLIQEAQQDYQKYSELAEEEVKEFAEQKAKRIISICIDRFHKEMSTERGIAASYFPSEHARKIFSDHLKENIEVIQKASGCDIHIDENPDQDRWQNIQIIGYDPVRRELTRRIFDRIFRDIEKHKKKILPNELQRVCENLKSELLNQIKRDGDLICKELGLQHVNPEVRQVMGSLRFRYSYTQNQYFHCAEVGWFAGLLAAELGNEIKKSRRAGMLHDLGKALDHELDGSHAVIGADFISTRGEKDDVIYAVRAHHHDVTPTHDMDFLVIAADAISGGRPGARRSTVETYTQKVSGLQEISKRFHGVTDVFVLNGGRECRVLVNSRQVDDLGALKISQQIAKTIEDEMQYPGQIKVVVVRETVTSESTSGRNKQDR